MLEKLLALVAEGSIHSYSDLARCPSIVQLLLEMMPEDLAQLGYLRSVGNGCDGCAKPALFGHCLGHVEGNPQSQVDADEPSAATGDGQQSHVIDIPGWAVAEVLMSGGTVLDDKVTAATHSESSSIAKVGLGDKV